MEIKENLQEIEKQTHKNFLSLFLFSLGLILCFAVFIWPVSRDFVINLARSSLIGVLAIGFLYAISFTSALATGMVISATAVYSPLTLAIIGGLGALIYDIIIFLFVKKITHQGFFSRLREKYLDRPSISWLFFVIGAFIIASPLPDELGSGLFGASKLKPKYFIPISFILNAFGILIIALIVD